MAKATTGIIAVASDVPSTLAPSDYIARLRKVVQEQSFRPFLKVAKEKVCRYSDVVLPRGCEEPVSTWLRSQPEGGIVTCRNKQERHGNAGKRSNYAKVRLL